MFWCKSQYKLITVMICTKWKNAFSLFYIMTMGIKCTEILQVAQQENILKCLCLNPPGRGWSCPTWPTSLSRCWRFAASLFGCRFPMMSTCAWRSCCCSAQVRLPPESSWTCVTKVIISIQYYRQCWWMHKAHLSTFSVKLIRSFVWVQKFTKLHCGVCDHLVLQN